MANTVEGFISGVYNIDFGEKSLYNVHVLTTIQWKTEE